MMLQIKIKAIEKATEVAKKVYKGLHIYQLKK